MLPCQIRMNTIGLLERLTCLWIILTLAFILSSSTVSAQTFVSGSTGVDGALDFSGVPANTTVLFNPDAFNPVTLDNVSAVVVEIEARNIPVGTVVRLSISSETGPQQMVQSTPLAGTMQVSNATATMTLPHGFSRFSVQANWTP